MSKGRQDKANVLLITGMPGIGKTTVIPRIADRGGRTAPSMVSLSIDGNGRT